jgi:hypothetical protein
LQWFGSFFASQWFGSFFASIAIESCTFRRRHELAILAWQRKYTAIGAFQIRGFDNLAFPARDHVIAGSENLRCAVATDG